MLGLIKKDLLLIKANIKTLILIILIYLIMTLQETMNASFLTSFIAFLVIITTFNYDSYNKWDAFAATLPEGRKNVVRAKYLSSIIIHLLTAITVILILFIFSLFIKTSLDLKGNIISIIASSCATLIIQSIIYPIIFKIGIEKARIIIAIIFVASVVIIGFFAKIIPLNAIITAIEFIAKYSLIIIPLVIFSIIFISYKISQSIYLKKSF